MAVAYTDAMTAFEQGTLRLVQIETQQERRICTECGYSLISAHFWGHRGGTGKQKWFQTKRCASCRVGNRSMFRKSTEPTLQEQRNAEAAALARSRNRPGTDSYLDSYGQRRCKRCRSTLYRSLVLLEADRHPVGYIVEWVCWHGGHVVLERWRLGSPVRGRFPISESAPSIQELRPVRPKDIPLLKRLAYDQTQNVKAFEEKHKRTKNMKMVRVDVELGDGCDTRCEMLRYRDPDDDHSPIYLRRMHHPEAHNDYGTGKPHLAVRFSWRGFEVDFEEHELAIDGVQIVPKSSRYPSPVEWKLLRTLVRQSGKVVSQEVLLHAVWGDTYINEPHLLRVNMARIRKKLDAHDSHRFIETINGIGYRFGRSGMHGQNLPIEVASG